MINTVMTFSANQIAHSKKSILVTFSYSLNHHFAVDGTWGHSHVTLNGVSSDIHPVGLGV